MAIYFSLLILCIITYIILMNTYAKGWKNQPLLKFDALATIPNGISIIIPARNEASNIKKCIDSILNQAYNGEYEIIVIDDNSTDETNNILMQYGKAITTIKNDEKVLNDAYKKRAITKGIAIAKYKVIVCTDADTLRGKYWLASIASAYKPNTYKIYIGPVDYMHTNTLLAKFETVDFITMQGITAAGIYLNLGASCNGANLIFDKSTFESVNGYEGVDNMASGDDILLLHKILAVYSKSAFFIKHTNAIVQTYSTNNWASFVSQRIRWASKSKLYKDVALKIVLSVIFIFNILLLFGLVLVYKGLWVAGGITFILIAKIISEAAITWPSLNFYNKSNLKIWHIILQPLHIAYIVLCAGLGLFKTYTWKNRIVK
jgi:cellulose synthase/poly-beta-1,6-N-acetylglucosamine synthase-like glycosyltransferase